LYYLPETFLSDLVNQSVRGTWTLEFATRAGPSDTNTVGQLISWQMQFIYQNNAPAAVPLSPFDPSTNCAGWKNRLFHRGRPL
jgi:subtilisin-like proprotein convertase family protein